MLKCGGPPMTVTRLNDPTSEYPNGFIAVAWFTSAGDLCRDGFQPASLAHSQPETP